MPARDVHTLVKVCGITRLEDARMALAAGADWLGFVLWEGSPRRVESDVAAEILWELPGTCGVAVLVGATPDGALAAARAIGARRVQLHRCDPSTWPPDFPLPVAFSIPVGSDGQIGGELPAVDDLVMLDAADEVLPGGTGRSVPWEAAAAIAARRPVLLAGGLDAGNVATALSLVRPFGVDAASRLERSPGVKDPDRVRRFVAAVRAWDARDAGGPAPDGVPGS